MSAILQAPGRGAAPNNGDFEDARKMAELLARTTQAGIAMAQSMDLSGAADQGDSVRMALAALAGRLVGDAFRNNGKTPGEADVKKLASAMQVVLSYAENFAPTPENAQRLKELEADGRSVDAYQATLQYIEAFLPVVSAIGSFPFGHPEQRLVMEVTGRLVQKVSALRGGLFPSLPGAAQKPVEMALLRALGRIYAACHNAETARLTALDDARRAALPQAQGGGLALDSLWGLFDVRVGMLEALARGMAAPGGGAGSQQGGIAPAPVAAPPPPPVFTAPPVVAAPPVVEAPPAPPQGANPLSMFAKKPPDPGAVVPPPAGGTPMSFFKAPPKKE